jgi:hypothetical protein
MAIAALVISETQGWMRLFTVYLAGTNVKPLGLDEMLGTLPQASTSRPWGS